MKKLIALSMCLALSACAELPSIGADTGLTFTQVNGKPAARFDTPADLTLVVADEATGKKAIFQNAQWQSSPASYVALSGDLPVGDELLILTDPGRVIVFERASWEEPRIIIGLDFAPCLPNDGCGGTFGTFSTIVTDLLFDISLGQTVKRHCPYRTEAACDAQCASCTRGPLRGTHIDRSMRFCRHSGEAACDMQCDEPCI